MTRRAVEMDPFTPDNVQNLGLCYGRAQRYEEALANTEEVLELEPNNLRARFDRSEYLQRLGEHAAAIEKGRWPTHVRPAAVNAHRVLYELMYARDLT